LDRLQRTYAGLLSVSRQFVAPGALAAGKTVARTVAEYR
jgi:hypothetical protein